MAQKIVQRTGLGKQPSAIRDHIRRAHVDDHTKKKLLHDYDRLLQGKPIVKHDLKEFLHTLGDKNVMTLPSGTYLYTIAHNPENVLKHAERQERVERHERIVEQQHERDTDLAKERELKQKEDDEEDEKKEKHGQKVRDGHAPLKGHAPQEKGGIKPLPRFIKAA